jgi:hypothetical protein
MEIKEMSQSSVRSTSELYSPVFLPRKVMKTVIMYLAPSTLPTPYALFVQSVGAFFLGLATAGFTWMGGQHPVIQILIILQVGDYLSNVYAMTRPDGERGFWSQFSHAESIRGFARKTIIGVLALGLWHISTLAKPYVGPMSEVLALTIIGIAALMDKE